MPVDKRPISFRTSFNQVADDYHAVRPSYPPSLIKDVVSLAAIPSAGRILEIGCGTGQATIPFAERGYHMVCLDIGPALAALAEQKCRPYPEELRSAAQFVTQVAIRRSITFLVAIQASCHRNLFLLPQHSACLYFAMTSRASGFGFQVSLMAEEDKAGQFINAHPGNFLLGLFILHQWLQRCACRLQFAMTS
jgi:SAM-dependent methyltransferase